MMESTHPPAFTPINGLSADSSRVVICRVLHELSAFNKHKRHFDSKRWKDQYNAIKSYAADRGYPPGELAVAYVHYRQRVIWRDDKQVSPHPDERKNVKKSRQRKNIKTQHLDGSSLAIVPVFASSSLLLPMAMASEVPAADSGMVEQQRLDEQVEREPVDEALEMEQVDNTQDEERAENKQVKDQVENKQVEALPVVRSRSKYHRLHEDTKMLEALFTHYSRRCGLLHNADADIANLPEKRARRPPSQSWRAVPRAVLNTDNVSTGYAECTRESFDNICQYLCEEIEPAALRMGADSVFLDIGSGYGKCVVQARWRADVRKSIGIEYLAPRHVQALTMLEDHVPKQFPATHARLKPEESIELLEGDATQEQFAEVIERATHIFMFDVVFSDADKHDLLRVLAGRKFRVLMCCQPPYNVAALSLTLIHQLPLKTSGGRQSFTCYFYTAS
jgi:hypothetical protein